MTLDLSAFGTRALVLDVEGTTTPITFVSKVLFPYARTHAAGFLGDHAGEPEVRDAVDMLRAEQAAEPAAPPEDLLQYVFWLMDRDRKSPGLKALQGLIWKEGYRRGELRGQVYPDVLPALVRWRACGLQVHIYSSGSVLAQRLLFSSTPEGDLTAHLDGYFDTGIGPKIVPESYAAIAERVGVAPSKVLFVSDLVKELDAARAAGLRTALCVRDAAPDGVRDRSGDRGRSNEGSSPQPAPASSPAHPVLHSFDEID